MNCHQFCRQGRDCACERFALNERAAKRAEAAIYLITVLVAVLAAWGVIL